MFELYSDDIKSEYSSNSKDIFKYSTIYIYIYIYCICIYIYIKLCTNETTSELATTKCMSKFPNRKKISNE